MRAIVILILVAMFAQTEARASTYLLPAQGDFTVDGPFQTFSEPPLLPYYLPITATVSVLADLPVINPPPGGYFGFSAFIGVSSD